MQLQHDKREPKGAAAPRDYRGNGRRQRRWSLHNARGGEGGGCYYTESESGRRLYNKAGGHCRKRAAAEMAAVTENGRLAIRPLHKQCPEAGGPNINYRKIVTCVSYAHWN